VGTLYVGVAVGDLVHHKYFRLFSDREQMRQFSVICALDELRKTLLARPPADG
jgi:nicotinamide mononucleotide (NMN) deamidase PncC